MHKAFTMIELIFVIVIVGVLSAVAVRKLAATRDDAKVAAMANSITSAAEEIAARAVASGNGSTDLPNMSQIVQGMIAQNKATFSNGVLMVKMNTVDDCIKLEVVSSIEDLNLTMSYGQAGGDQVCLALQRAISAEEYPIPLAGKRTRW